MGSKAQGGVVQTTDKVTESHELGVRVPRGLLAVDPRQHLATSIIGAATARCAVEPS
jgi:hypothetical protein